MPTKKNLIKSEKNLKKLCDDINSLCIFLNDIYKINSGGCCYVASVLAELLESDNIEYTVIVYDSDFAEFWDIDCSQYHYTLCVSDIILNDYNFEECAYEEYDNVSSADLLEHYNECAKNYDWNEVYNHSRNDYIKEVITNFYNDFTSSLREE